MGGCRSLRNVCYLTNQEIAVALPHVASWIPDHLCLAFLFERHACAAIFGLFASQSRRLCDSSLSGRSTSFRVSGRVEKRSELEFALVDRRHWRCLFGAANPGSTRAGFVYRSN